MTELFDPNNYRIPFYGQQNNLINNAYNPNCIKEQNNKEYNFINQKPIKHSDIFICPKCKCKQECTIKVNKYNIRIICDDCGFQSNYISKDFDQSQYRDILYINCMFCNKYISEDDCFYSLNYKLNICQECKYNYYQNFDDLIIPYTDINSYCLEHRQKFISYCHRCNKNCCLQCQIEDKEEAHIKEGFELNIKKRKKELEKVKKIYKAFKEKVLNDFLYLYNSLLPKESIKIFVKKLMNNIDIPFNLYYDIISSYGKIRTRKHLMNQNQFNMDCFYNDFIKINEEKDSIKSIQYFIELCKEVTHTNSATLIYGVNEKNLIDGNYIEMKIFAKEFVEQNKDNCRINFKKVISKLKENFRFKKEDINVNKVTIQLEIKKNDIKDLDYFCDGANLIECPDIDKILVKKNINNFNEVIHIQRNNPINDSLLSLLTEYQYNEYSEKEKQNSNKDFIDNYNKYCEKEEEIKNVLIKENDSNSKFSSSNNQQKNLFSKRNITLQESSIPRDSKTSYKQNSNEEIKQLNEDIIIKRQSEILNLIPENNIAVQESSKTKDYKASCEQNSNDENKQLHEDIKMKNQRNILGKVESIYTSNKEYDFSKIEKIKTYFRNNFSFEAIYNFLVDIRNNCRELFNIYKTEFFNLIKREFSNLDSWYNVRYDPGINILKNENRNETPITDNNNAIIVRNKEIVEPINMNNNIKEESPPFKIKELIDNTVPRIININSVRCNYNSRELYKFIFWSIITNHNSGRILFTHNGIKFHLVLISCNYGNKIVYISFLTNCVLLFYLKRRKCLIKFNFPYGYLFANNKFIINKNNNLIPFK